MGICPDRNSEGEKQNLVNFYRFVSPQHNYNSNSSLISYWRYELYGFKVRDIFLVLSTRGQELRASNPRNTSSRSRPNSPSSIYWQCLATNYNNGRSKLKSLIFLAISELTNFLIQDDLNLAIDDAIDTSDTFVPIITPSFIERVKETPLRELNYAIDNRRRIKSIWIGLDPRKSSNKIVRYIARNTECLYLPKRILDWKRILRHVIGSYDEVLDFRMFLQQLARIRGPYLGHRYPSANTPVHPSRSRKVFVWQLQRGECGTTDLLNKLENVRVGHKFILLGNYGVYNETHEWREADVFIILIRTLPSRGR